MNDAQPRGTLRGFSEREFDHGVVRSRGVEAQDDVAERCGPGPEGARLVFVLGAQAAPHEDDRPSAAGHDRPGDGTGHESGKTARAARVRYQQVGFPSRAEQGGHGFFGNTVGGDP
ncbi:hypothetical protein HUT19_39985 [Streptomyces sp. NA02950]|nr:hypothetical protein HUT19_39985 [Streptomyces sp. NA02950]